MAIGIGAILLGIGTVAKIIYDGVKDVVSKAIDIFGHILSTIWHLVNGFINNAPKAFRLWLWLFLFSSIGGILISIFLSNIYVCTSTNELREHDSIFGGVVMMGESYFGGIDDSNISYDEYVYEHSIPTIMTETTNINDMVRIRCADTEPELTFFGINLFNFSTMLILLSLGITIKLLGKE